MPGDQGAALRTALAYFEAWTGREFARAMELVADDIVCDAPAGRIEGTDAFRAFMGPFAESVTRASLIAAFGDDETALVMYDTDTILVSNAPGAEAVTVRDGRIARMRIIFDRLPFERARRSAAEPEFDRTNGGA